MAMVLKTIRGGDIPRGFESHALRSDLGKPVLTWAYARLSDVAGSSPAAARCSRLPPFVAGRGIYAGWILKRFPRSNHGKRKGPAESETLHGRSAASASSILLLAASLPPSMHFAYTRSSTSTL